MPAAFNAGDRVTYSGYPGAVVRLYCEGMYEVRLPGGVACVGASDLVLVERAKPPEGETFAERCRKWTAETARQRVGGTFGT